jgi:hypothetical protein
MRATSWLGRNRPRRSVGRLGAVPAAWPRGECVLTVDGELDLLTTPASDCRSSTGPLLWAIARACLVRPMNLAHTSGSQLYLAGLVTHAVARLLHITGLMGILDTIPSWLRP